VSGLALACSGDDDDEPEATPSTQEKVAYCENVAETTASLAAMKAAVGPPLNQVALVDSRQDAAAHIELLRFPAEQLQGGADALDTLKQDLDELNKLFATQDVSANADAIRTQAAVVENDLRAMNELGNCP
jgi:hypothetical protein